MGLFEPTCVQFSGGRIGGEKNQIDLYVWLGLKDNRAPSLEYGVLGNPSTHERVCELLEIDPAKVKKLTSAA
jgi:hypothetical protein